MELYDINNRRLSTRETLSVSFQVVGEERPEQLTQSFIVVDNITESCVLGLDALYEHKFMFDGSERSIYRVREPDHLPFSPICVAQRKMEISTRSVLVVDSGGGGGELPPDKACFFVPAPELPQGIRVDPRLSKERTDGLFKIYLINDSDIKVKLPKFQVLGRISLKKNPCQIVAACTTSSNNTNDFDPVQSNIPAEGKVAMKNLLDNSHYIFGSKTEELGCTGVVKHKIDTERRGPICLRAYRNSP